MDALSIFNYLLFWGSMGCGIFTIIVIAFCRTGVPWAPRSSLKSVLGSIIILGGIMAIQILSNYFGLNLQAITLDFWTLFFLNYGLYYFLFLFDTLVIDILVIVIWHPKFLKLPENEVTTSLKYHLKTLPAGTIIGAGITILTSLISYTLFF